MIGISKLYCGTVEPSDVLRYGARSKDLPSNLLQFSTDKKPVLVWNCTRRCNLKCVHCYSHSADKLYDEMTTDQGLALIEDLAEFGAPVMLFSGGEPLTRKDLFTLVSKAAKLEDVGLSYVGVSLDGLKDVNDKFRGVAGAFEKALTGIRNCRQAGIKVGLRFTVTKRNIAEVPKIFQLLRDEDIPRACFYHLAYAGRGIKLQNEDLDHQQTRDLVDMIIDETAKLHADGLPKEVLTVDNHVDGPFLYLRMIREGNPNAENVLKLMRMNGGNSSGAGIGCVSWDGPVRSPYR